MKSSLDQLHSEYARDERLVFDPLFLLDRRIPAADQEIVSFILAGLAYGRVEQIQNSGRDLLRRLQTCGIGATGEGLAESLKSEAFLQTVAVSLKGWKHRLNTEGDLNALFLILSQVLRSQGSLKNLMGAGKGTSTTESVVNFSATLTKLHSPQKKKPRAGKLWSGTGPEWFFASPLDGSSCKRLMLWLRWMVRANDIDPGIWNHLNSDPLPIAAGDLLIPLDVHIFRWAQQKKITTFKTPSWKAVEQISNYMRKIDPVDPLKYDFAIFQESMEKSRKAKNVKKALLKSRVKFRR